MQARQHCTEVGLARLGADLLHILQWITFRPQPIGPRRGAEAFCNGCMLSGPWVVEPNGPSVPGCCTVTQGPLCHPLQAASCQALVWWNGLLCNYSACHSVLTLFTRARGLWHDSLHCLINCKAKFGWARHLACMKCAMLCCQHLCCQHLCCQHLCCQHHVVLPTWQAKPACSASRAATVD